jgi:hypothetical protein
MKESLKQLVVGDTKTLKEEFNQWGVEIGRDLAFEIGKPESESQPHLEIEKGQPAILTEKTNAPNAECEIRGRK